MTIGDALTAIIIAILIFLTCSTEGQQVINALVGCPQVCSTDEGEAR